MGKRIIVGQHMVDAIVKHLSQFCGLPAEGILAGQAVSSAILDLYGEGGGVYNDVDVFVKADAACIAELGAHREEEALELGMGAAFFDEYDGLQWADEENYTIEGTTREGMLNLVWCSLLGEQTLLSPTRVLASFDLNCVGVAVDLATRRLYWTPAFEQFLHTRQLQLTSLATPVKTVLRYAKKRAELAGVYGDDAFNLRLAASAACLATGNPTVSGFSPAFPALTPKHAEQFRQYPLLEDCFHLGPVDPDGRFPVLIHRHPEQDYVDSLLALTGGQLSLEQLPRLAYSKALQPPEDAEKLVTRFWRMFEDRTPMAESFEHFSFEYVRGNHSQRHVTVISKTVNRHPRLANALYGLTLDQQYVAVQALQRLAKREGNWVFGLVESNAIWLDLVSPENIQAFFERERHFGSESLQGKLFEDQYVKGWTVRDLVTRQALCEEGATMRHCVEGYAATVAKGTSRILSLRSNLGVERWSTVELDGKALKDKRLVVRQHRGRNNAPVHRHNRRVLRLFLTQLAHAQGWQYEPPVRRKSTLVNELLDF